MWLAWISIAALAGDGPWVLEPGATNLFLGLDYVTYGTLRNPDGSTMDLGSGLTGAGPLLVVTRGLIPAVEIELKLPYERVRANQPDSAFCTTDRPSDWCAVTAGLGDVTLLTKLRVLDEARLNPLSASLLVGARSGEAYSEHRGRITTLGDGQTDVGLGLGVGRAAGLGAGWYRVSASAAYWYRLPHRRAGGLKIPSDEITATADLLLAPSSSVGFGLAGTGFWRLAGLDVAEADFNQIDGFASLRGEQIKAGLKAAVFGERGLTLFATGLRTVYAVNNPIDTLAVSIGIGAYLPAPGDT